MPAEAFCRPCMRIVVLVGDRCRRCKRQLVPISPGWDERSKHVKAAQQARQKQGAAAEAGL